MVRLLVTVGTLNLLAGLIVAQAAQSGNQPGQVLPGPFRTFVVTGAQTKPPAEAIQPEERQNLGDVNRLGKFHDFVTHYSLEPTVAVFAREIPAADHPVGKLLEALDQAVVSNRAARLHAFAVFLTLKGDYFQDETWASQIKQIEALADQLKLKAVPLAFDKSDSAQTKAYQIAPENAVVVLVYANQTVQARYIFSADKPLDDAAIKTVMGDVSKLVGSR